MIGNEGGRLNMVFGKEIKGGSLRDKRRSFGRERWDFWTLNPEKLRENKPERKKRKEKGKRE